MANKPLPGPYDLDPFQSDIVAIKWGDVGPPNESDEYQCSANEIEELGPRINQTLCIFQNAQPPAMRLIIFSRVGTTNNVPRSALAGTVTWTGLTSGTVLTWVGPADCGDNVNRLGSNGGFWGNTLGGAGDVITVVRVRDGGGAGFIIGETVRATW